MQPVPHLPFPPAYLPRDLHRGRRRHVEIDIKDKKIIGGKTQRVRFDRKRPAATRSWPRDGGLRRVGTGAKHFSSAAPVQLGRILGDITSV